MLFRKFFVLKRVLYLSTVFILTTLLSVMSSTWLKAQTLDLTQPHVFYVALNGSDTNEGSFEHPWATVNHAAAVLKAGETVYVRAGTYPLTQQIHAKNSGTADQWITYRAFPQEQAILDAQSVRVAPPSGRPPFAQDQGAFQLENVQYVQVQGLKIINSHNSGITVRNTVSLNRR